MPEQVKYTRFLHAMPIVCYVCSARVLPYFTVEAPTCFDSYNHSLVPRPRPLTREKGSGDLQPIPRASLS